jgi:predicted dehydrogenase
MTEGVVGTSGTAAPVRVGIVGGNVDQGWAADSHIPALRALSGFTLSAVCTTRRESADHAAAVLGAEAHVNPAAMANAAGVDLVAVCVKVPDHAAAVLPALEAGKPVYCEWPLGRTTEDAERMAALARSRRVATVVGLQARGSLELNHVRALIADGYVGAVTSVCFYGAYGFWSDTVTNRFMADVTQGINLLTIPVGHTLDALAFVLGDELRSVQAVVESKRGETRIRSTGERLELTSPDHVGVLGRYGNGALLSAQFLGGAARRPHSRIEIDGAEGGLSLQVDGLIENRPIQIKGYRKGGGDAEVLTPPPSLVVAPEVPPGAPFNVGQMYARFGRELAGGARSLPDFDHAVRLHRLLDAIRMAAETGRTVEV